MRCCRGFYYVVSMADFRNLRVWQKANALSVAAAMAVEELRGVSVSILRVQLLRSTFSIQANKMLSGLESRLSSTDPDLPNAVKEMRTANSE